MSAGAGSAAAVSYFATLPLPISPFLFFRYAQSPV